MQNIKFKKLKIYLNIIIFYILIEDYEWSKFALSWSRNT